MNKVDSIVLDRKQYKSDEEMLNTLSKYLQLFLSSNYICVVCRDDINDKYIIEYSSANPFEGEPYPYFLYPDEATAAMSVHNKELKKEMQKKIKEIDNYEDILDTFDEVEQRQEEKKKKAKTNKNLN